MPIVPLVLLAAGLGSRYGGVKPLAPVGPNGEPLLAVALDQAAEAGFDRAIVVVSDATGDAIRSALGNPALPVTFVAQGSVGPPRAKPWGTTAAVIAVGIDHDIVVANGDDLYGIAGLTMARRWMGSSSPAHAAAVLYPVGRTMSSRGGVSRALPVIEHGRLVGLDEQRDVERIAGVVRLAEGRALADEQPVSMNLWCLRTAALRSLQRACTDFLRDHDGDEAAELGLSSALSNLLPGLQIEALVTDSPWHGVTFATDVDDVRRALIAGR